jgi:hypothetical protein
VIDPTIPRRLARFVNFIPHVRALVHTWQGRLILLFVLGQLLLPLHYYVANRDDHDERFAWRMFSPMRMTRCQVNITRDDQPVPLGKEFHEAWLELASRGRLRVLEEMGARLCAQKPSSSVRIFLDCTYLDRKEPVRIGGFDICDAPQL